MGRGTAVSEVEGVRSRKRQRISPDLETDPSGFTGPRAESQSRAASPWGVGGFGHREPGCAGGQGSIPLSSRHQPPLLSSLGCRDPSSPQAVGSLPGAHRALWAGRGFSQEVPVHGYLCGTRLQHLLPELKDLLSGLPHASSGILAAWAGPPFFHLAVHLQMDTSVC